jgi:hypothetical protein
MQSAFFTRGRRTFATCALAGTIAVGLSACGSSGSSASSSTSASSSSASSRSAERVKYAECLRSHGVNVPDPSSSGGFPGGGGGAPGGGGGTSTTGGGPGGYRALLSTATGQAAEKACASLRGKSFGAGGGNPADQAKFAAAAVKFAECMRAHNIDIPDPSTSSGGAFSIFKDLRGSSETNSPAFKSAMTACSSDLPFRRGGGAPGSGGSAVGGPGA